MEKSLKHMYNSATLKLTFKMQVKANLHDDENATFMH